MSSRLRPNNSTLNLSRSRLNAQNSSKSFSSAKREEVRSISIGGRKMDINNLQQAQGRKKTKDVYINPYGKNSEGFHETDLNDEKDILLEYKTKVQTEGRNSINSISKSFCKKTNSDDKCLTNKRLAKILFDNKNDQNDKSISNFKISLSSIKEKYGKNGICKGIFKVINNYIKSKDKKLSKIKYPKILKLKC